MYKWLEKISIAQKLLVGNGYCTPNSSDEAVQVSSAPLKQWEAGLVQAFRDLTSSLCSSSMTPYLIIHQRSLYNHPAGLLPRARILVSRERDYELQILLKTLENGIIYSESALCAVT